MTEASQRPKLRYRVILSFFEWIDRNTTTLLEAIEKTPYEPRRNYLKRVLNWYLFYRYGVYTLTILTALVTFVASLLSTHILWFALALSGSLAVGFYIVATAVLMFGPSMCCCCCCERLDFSKHVGALPWAGLAGLQWYGAFLSGGNLIDSESALNNTVVVHSDEDEHFDNSTEYTRFKDTPGHETGTIINPPPKSEEIQQI
jgi:hypothetical protein